MYRNILRRQSLFNDATNFIFSDRRQRCVVAVKKREANVFVLYKERGSRVCGVAVTETEDAFIGALTRDNLFEGKSEVFSFSAFEFDFPILAVFLPYFENKLCLSGGLKTEIQIVANDSPVDLYYPVAAFEIHFGTEAMGSDFKDLDSPAANVCDCWCDCKLVHDNN